MFKYFTEGPYYLTTDKNSWGIFGGERGRIEVQQMEDEAGGLVESSDRMFKEWKKGEIDLWLVNYSIYTKMVKMHEPTEKELQEFTGLQVI